MLVTAYWLKFRTHKICSCLSAYHRYLFVLRLESETYLHSLMIWMNVCPSSWWYFLRKFWNSEPNLMKLVTGGPGHLPHSWLSGQLWCDSSAVLYSAHPILIERNLGKQQSNSPFFTCFSLSGSLGQTDSSN